MAKHQLSSNVFMLNTIVKLTWTPSF